MITRRKLLLTATGGMIATALPGLGGAARAADDRSLRFDTLGASLGINVPLHQALHEGIATYPGQAAATVQPTQMISQIVQSIIAGSADLGDADVISTLAAAEAGANVKIIGLSYNSASQVIIINKDKVSSLEDLTQPGRSVAVASMGDFVHCLLAGALHKRGIAVNDVAVMEIGGSTNRTKAFLAGRVDAAAIHIDQASALMSQGNYEILMKPWEEYDVWFNAVIVATGEWLERPENKTAAVDLLKATLTAFRKANTDAAWYEENYRKFVSSKTAKTAPASYIEDMRKILSQDVKAWPDDMQTMTVENFKKVVPTYQLVGTIKGTADLSKIVDRTYLDQALKELS